MHYMYREINKAECKMDKKTDLMKPAAATLKIHEQKSHRLIENLVLILCVNIFIFQLLFYYKCLKTTWPWFCIINK